MESAGRAPYATAYAVLTDPHLTHLRLAGQPGRRLTQRH